MRLTRKHDSNLVAALAVIVVVVILLVGPRVIQQMALAQASITVGIMPSQSSYAPNQQVTIRGTLSCSGQCPMVLLPNMDVHLASSWGWSVTVQTDDRGVYSTGVSLPALDGTYTVTAKYAAGGMSTQATRQVVVELGAIPEFPPTILTITPFLLLILATGLLMRRRKSCQNKS